MNNTRDIDFDRLLIGIILVSLGKNALHTYLVYPRLVVYVFRPIGVPERRQGFDVVSTRRTDAGDHQRPRVAPQRVLQGLFPSPSPAKFVSTHL